MLKEGGRPAGGACSMLERCSPMAAWVGAGLWKPCGMNANSFSDFFLFVVRMKNPCRQVALPRSWQGRYGVSDRECLAALGMHGEHDIGGQALRADASKAFPEYAAGTPAAGRDLCERRTEQHTAEAESMATK